MQPQPAPSARQAWFVVSLLLVAYVFSFLDRQILNLMVAPIRRDLGVSDTQISLLMGFSFALFYTLLGIPLGRVADTRNRRGLIVLGLLFWSLMTSLCGTAKQYWQLFLYRVGVGAGEAALSPAAYSMIADYFPPERRATAMSVYSMGIYIGSGMAFLLGGLVVQFAATQGEVVLPLVGPTRPWQVVFYVLGLSGILFSLVLLLIREPVRTGAGAQTATPLREVLAYLRRNGQTVLSHNLGFALLGLCAYAAMAWIPTVFIRIHGWSAPQIGVCFGLIVMIAGSLGLLAGGALADRWRKDGHVDAPMRVGMLSALLLLPSTAAYLLIPQAPVAAIFLAPAMFATSMPFGVAAAAIQDIMPSRMRAQASAVYLFVVNMIGLGVGPTAVALLTDYLFERDNAVHYSVLLVVVLGAVLAAAILHWGRQAYGRSLAALDQLS